MLSTRLVYLAVTLLIVILGLASRKFGHLLPDFIAAYSGDALWAAMVYFGLRVFFPAVSVVRVGVWALVFSYCIEVSQLYQADWINAIRSTTLGALVLGHGFLWSDMVCYTVGVGVAMGGDYKVLLST